MTSYDVTGYTTVTSGGVSYAYDPVHISVSGEDYHLTGTTEEGERAEAIRHNGIGYYRVGEGVWEQTDELGDLNLYDSTVCPPLQGSTTGSDTRSVDRLHV